MQSHPERAAISSVVAPISGLSHTGGCVPCRFSARGREYKYYILQHGDLDIGAMQAAAAHFVGEHDFRNFCKVDAQHISNFRRRVLDFRWASLRLAALYMIA